MYKRQHNKPYEGRGYERSRQREKRVLQDRGNLKDSIEVSKIDLQKLSFTINTGTQVDDYAEIHNEGGEITVTSDMQKFFWAKFYEIAGDDRRSQNINPDAEFWRNMALKKVGDKIVIPKRAFLGVSKFLEAKIQKIAQKTFEKLL